jgi:signal transduction histidine kinase/CheY-like chemotaxis protein
VKQSSRGDHDERFLIAAPIGRDAPLTCALLEREGFDCLPCKDMDELCTRFEREGAAGLLIAQEVLVSRAVVRLRAALAQQESWSDVPIVLFTASSAGPSLRQPSSGALAPLGNVTLLERPISPITMISAANAALRTRRRQYEARAELVAQQRAVRERDQFLAMLGHELRNPLAAIALANSLDDAAEEPHRRDVIRRQVNHLTRLVDDLLDVARVTSGKIALRVEQRDLREIVRSSVAVLSPVMGERSPPIRVRMPETPVIVRGDPVRLEQVIVNLLTNAAKYTPVSGRIDLVLEQDHGMAQLEVRDTGVGIAEDMLDRVFELFTQVEGSLARSQGGLGIGLTLVRDLVTLHGGTVEACSRGSGQGSSFRVRLPLSMPAPEVVEVANEPDSAAISGIHTAANESHYAVLVVEDNADSRELLTLVLERLGHRVYAAEDGLRGVELALAQKPDVLMVDIGLPGLDGYGVAHRVRAALGPEVYLIAVTGYGQPEDRRRALEAGFNAHVTKPLDVSSISQLLDKAQPMAAASSA